MEMRFPFSSRVDSLMSNFSFLTLPSFPGYTSITLANFHWLRGVVSSCRRTTSLTFAFLQSLIHFCLCWRFRRYSFFHRVQKWLAKSWTQIQTTSLIPERAICFTPITSYKIHQISPQLLLVERNNGTHQNYTTAHKHLIVYVC